MHDGVLRLKLPSDVTSLAYANDLAIIIKAKDNAEITCKTNEAIDLVDIWMYDNNIKLATEKTGAIILKGKGKINDIVFLLHNEEMPIEKSIRYEYSSTAMLGRTDQEEYVKSRKKYNKFK